MSGNSNEATRSSGSWIREERAIATLPDAIAWVLPAQNTLITLTAVAVILSPFVYVSNQFAALTEMIDRHTLEIGEKIDSQSLALNEKIDSHSLSLNGKIDNLSGRIDGLDRRFDGFERRFDRPESRLAKIESMMSEMQVDLGIVLYRLDERSARASGIGEGGDTE